MATNEHSRDRSALIWETVLLIPEGRVASYGQVAEETGLPGRARLVGHVLGRLPEESAVPWHRVLRASGHLAFPPHSERHQLQRALLESEGVDFVGTRVSLDRFGWRR